MSFYIKLLIKLSNNARKLNQLLRYIKGKIIVLYLAEVQKVTQFVGFKTELKLLACQRNDQNWVGVPGDELVPVSSGDANNLKDGQIILAEVANKNVQRIMPDSARVLVTRLETFSRSLEKAKREKDETESMKLSLEAQFEELSKRQIEVESAREQVANLDEDFQRLQQERQEVQVLRKTAEQKQQEAERIKKELAEVRQEMAAKESEIKSREAELKKGALTPDQAAKMQDLVNQLAGVIPATDLAKNELKSVQEKLEMLQQFEGERTVAIQKSNEVKQQLEQWEKLQQDAFQIQNSVGEVKTELKVQKTTLNNKQELLATLNRDLEYTQKLYVQVTSLATNSAGINTDELDKMPLGELEEKVNNEQQELKKMVEFVNIQEEELREKGEIIEELKAKIKQVTEYERISLESELEDEKAAYDMLDQPLVGQRERIREKEANVQVYLRVLRQRQGIFEGDNSESTVNLKPILTALDTQQQQQAELIQRLDQEIQQIQSTMGNLQKTIDDSQKNQEVKNKEIQSLAANLQQAKQSESELWGKVNLYQQQLQSMPAALSNLYQKLQSVDPIITQIHDIQNNNVQEIQSLMQKLINN